MGLARDARRGPRSKQCSRCARGSPLGLPAMHPAPRRQRSGELLCVAVCLVCCGLLCAGRVLPPAPAAAPPEAECALSLLPGLLAQGRAPRLFVVGGAPWLTAFLRLRPATAPATLLHRNVSLWPRPDVMPLMTVEDALVLVVAERPDDLLDAVPVVTLPILTRTIMWTSAPPGWDSVPQLVLGLAPKCLSNSRLVLTSSNGTTVVYSDPCCCTGVPRPVRELDRCEPRRGWRAGAAVFPPPCRAWRRPAENRITASVSPPDVRMSNVWTTMRDFGKHHNYTVELRDEAPYGALARAVHCRLDFMLFPTSLVSNLHLTGFPWRMKSVFAVVRQSERRRGAWAVLKGEFSATLWYATGGATLAVAVGLYLLGSGGGGVVRAVLQASRLLVAQPVGRVPPLQRPLLGSWLLVAIVIASSYQGQLLSELLSKPVQNINSVAEIAASNLSVILQSPLFAELYQTKALGLRVEYAPQKSVAELLEYIGAGRNASTFIKSEVAGEFTEQIAKMRLHMFALPLGTPVSWVTVMKDSPLEHDMRRFLGRVRAAGLNLERRRLNQEVFARRKEGARGPRGLSLDNTFPAFALLGSGLAHASVALLGEGVYARMASRRRGGGRGA